MCRLQHPRGAPPSKIAVETSTYEPLNDLVTPQDQLTQPKSTKQFGRITSQRLSDLTKFYDVDPTLSPLYL